MAPELRQLQTWLKQVFTNSNGVAPIARESGSLLSSIVDQEDRTAVRGLEIYAEAYYARLHEILGEEFPRLADLVGEHNFQILVSDFLNAHPSQSPSVGDLGASLPEFVSKYLPTLERPYLAELARFERIYGNLVYRPLGEKFDLSHLAASDWPLARFDFAPSFEILRFEWPIYLLWKKEIEEADLKTQATSIGVCRAFSDQGGYASAISLEFKEVELINRLRRGTRIADALDGYENQPIREWFESWSEAGFLNHARI